MTELKHFRPNNTEVTAMKWDGTLSGAHEILAWVTKEHGVGTVAPNINPHFVINDEQVYKDNYIIKFVGDDFRVFNEDHVRENYVWLR